MAEREDGWPCHCGRRGTGVAKCCRWCHDNCEAKALAYLSEIDGYENVYGSYLPDRNDASTPKEDQ